MPPRHITSPAGVRVVALVGPDNAGDALLELLGRATGRLDAAVYEVSPYWAVPLRAAAAHGVAVRLLLDAHDGDGANPAALARLQGSGVVVRRLGRVGAAAHWKVVVSGTGTGAAVAVGSGNLLRLDLPRHERGGPELLAGTREWWLVVENDGRLAGIARRALAGAWAAAGRPGLPPPAVPAPAPAPGAVGTPHPQVAPVERLVASDAIELVTGGSATAAWLLAAARAARQRLLVTAPYVHARVPAVAALLDAVAAAATAGVDARLLLGSLAPADAAAADAAALAARLGAPVRVMDPARSTRGHAKGLVVDDLAVVTSANLSRAGLGANREATLAVRDAGIANAFAATFDSDWEASA